MKARTIKRREGEHLRSLFAYDPDSGLVTRLVKPRTGPGRPGDVVGSKLSNGYLQVDYRFDGKRRSVLAHRLAWFLFHGAWPLDEIDHVNGKPVDNRLVNLRLATRQENGRNRKRNRNNTSGVRGVSWFAGNSQWRARITIDGRQKHLGYFTTFEDAVQARVNAERIFFQEFAPEDDR